MENWKDIKSFSFNLSLCTSKNFFSNGYLMEFQMFTAELRWGRRQRFPSRLFIEVSFHVLGLHSSFQKKSCLEFVSFYYSSTSIWMVFCFTFEEAGRGLRQVECGVYYGFMSCFPICLLCLEQHGFHQEQTIPHSFILGVCASFYFAWWGIPRSAKREVSGLVCYGVSTSPLFCLITKWGRPFWVFLLTYLSRSLMGLLVFRNYLVLNYRWVDASRLILDWCLAWIVLASSKAAFPQIL